MEPKEADNRKYLVFFHEGPPRILTGDELNALQQHEECEHCGTKLKQLPDVWHGAKPLDQPRFTASGRLDNYKAVIFVTDLFDGSEILDNPKTNQPWDSKEEADAWAMLECASKPTLEDAYLADGAIEVTEAAGGTVKSGVVTETLTQLEGEIK